MFKSMYLHLFNRVTDALALSAVFLLRKVLPFPYEAMLIATALALSAVTLVFAFRFGKKR